MSWGDMKFQFRLSFPVVRIQVKIIHPTSWTRPGDKVHKKAKSTFIEIDYNNKILLV